LRINSRQGIFFAHGKEGIPGADFLDSIFREQDIIFFPEKIVDIIGGKLHNNIRTEPHYRLGQACQHLVLEPLDVNLNDVNRRQVEVPEIIVAPDHFELADGLMLLPMRGPEGADADIGAHRGVEFQFFFPGPQGDFVKKDVAEVIEGHLFPAGA